MTSSTKAFATAQMAMALWHRQSHLRAPLAFRGTQVRFRAMLVWALRRQQQALHCSKTPFPYPCAVPPRAALGPLPQQAQGDARGTPTTGPGDLRQSLTSSVGAGGTPDDSRKGAALPQRVKEAVVPPGSLAYAPQAGKGKAAADGGPTKAPIANGQAPRPSTQQGLGGSAGPAQALGPGPPAQGPARPAPAAGAAGALGPGTRPGSAPAAASPAREAAALGPPAPGPRPAGAAALAGGLASPALAAPHPPSPAGPERPAAPQLDLSPGAAGARDATGHERDPGLASELLLARAEAGLPPGAGPEVRRRRGERAGWQAPRGAGSAGQRGWGRGCAHKPSPSVSRARGDVGPLGRRSASAARWRWRWRSSRCAACAGGGG
jgi:hypothetical protein